ncbi:MAG TPA: hypothetical protein VEK08_03675 [Planctomycetota bacterium]|nr:hypothetical protein [Planctomycetota bacterium]
MAYKNTERREKLFATMLAAVLLLCISGSVRAGEPVVPPPDPGTGAAAEPAAQPDKKNDKWIFDPRGRRDPFTFSITPKIGDDSGSTTPGVDKPTEPGKVDIDPKLIIAKQKEAENLYNEAEIGFLEVGQEGHAIEVIAKCDAGMKVFADTPNAGTVPEWQPVRNRLEALRKAAERMKMRQDSRKKFDESNMRLTGIVARDRGSRAIVNGERVGKGDLVTSGENYVVSVDDIQQDQVILVTPESFKVKLTWSEIAK